MKIRVRLYGTLRETLAPDAQSEGIEVETPEGMTARDLLALLGISESRRAIVVMEGRVLGPDDPVRAGASVGVFQAISGGMTHHRPFHQPAFRGQSRREGAHG